MHKTHLYIQIYFINKKINITSQKILINQKT